MILAMNKRTSTRAAGVSPPWFGRHVYADTGAIARKTADSMWADHRCHRVQRYHGGLTPPALGRECERYGNRAYSSCKFDRNIAASGNAPTTHAYSICGFVTFTTGGLRPPLLAPVQRACAGRTTIFAVHERTFTRAAGVSPPWFGRHVYADTGAIARKTADSMWADHRCHRVQRYHGGLTLPAPGRECER
jgi:hypothetical protein